MIISVIANFYKSERYIPKLIKSVLAQTYTDWELICVNDCSPGNDKKILERYAAKDVRIRVVNNEINLGICKAKYRGIQEAKGTYLCFIDGDDWLEPEALQRMVEPALKNDLDMVIMNHYKVLPILGISRLYKSDTNEWGEVIELDPYAKEGLKARKKFVEYYGHFFGVNRFNTAYWGKLIKKEVIDISGFTPPDDFVGEDFYFGYSIFPYLKKIMFVDYAGYNWRWGGMTSGKKNNIWTGENNIRRSNEIYEDRVKLIEKYDLQCYTETLMIEQRNNFDGYMGQAAAYKPETKKGKALIQFLKEILKADFYPDFKKLKEYDVKYKNDELLDMLITRNAEGVYDYCYRIHKVGAKRRFVQNLIHSLLYPFARI